MKQQLRSSLGLLALLLVAASAFGQSTIARGKVPFNFIVSGKTLPAGEYIVRTNDRTISVQRVDSGRTTLVPIVNVEHFKSSTRSQLVFHKYGNTYFLRQVRNDGLAGYDLPKTKRETEAAADRRGDGGIAVAGMR
jgi:hypothetical protein